MSSNAIQPTVNGDVDLAIIGAGPAGLLTALEAARLRPDKRVAVIEARQDVGHDRVWCWWSCAEPPWPTFDHQWSSWRLVANGHSVHARAHRIHYRMLRASTLVRQASEQVASLPNLALTYGVSVDAQRLVDGGVVLALDSGGELCAPIVVDTRPPGLRPGAWRQAFRGWEVVANDPVFDPEAAVLMEFTPAAEHPCRFFYILPTSAHQALVEETIFTRAPLGPPGPEGLGRRLAALAPGGYQVVREEAAVLPMDPDLRAPPQVSRVVALGVRGGAARPATGYAFVGLARQARAFARAWARYPTRPARTPRARPDWAVWMDRVFLHVLDQDPARSRALFPQMFAGAPRASVRFLSDVGGLRAAGRVAMAMPKIPFIRAAADVGVRR